MFGLGWAELFLIFILALVVIGPKDLPKVMRVMAAMIARLRRMTQNIQKGWGEYMQLEQPGFEKKDKVQTLDGEELEKRNDQPTTS